VREFHHRCRHCGTGYSYQASGEGCHRPENDSTYCPECKLTTLKALEGIPKRFECRYRNVQEVPQYEGLTLNLLLKWEKEWKEEDAKKNVLRGQRIWFGDGHVREVRGRKEPDGPWQWYGTRFRLTTRSSLGGDRIENLTDYRIELPMEWDVVNKCFTGEHWRPENG
jgi:hypothetical protein